MGRLVTADLATGKPARPMKIVHRGGSTAGGSPREKTRKPCGATEEWLANAG
jgi:hypothetical protein